MQCRETIQSGLIETQNIEREYKFKDFLTHPNRIQTYIDKVTNITISSQLKVDAGANFLQIQPVYDVDCAKRFIEKIGSLNIPALISMGHVGNMSKILDYVGR